MHAASLVFLGGAVVTLAVGARAEGLGFLYISTGCSAVAFALVVAAIVQRMRSRPSSPGEA